MHLLAAFIPVIYMFMFLTHYFIFSRISPFAFQLGVVVSYQGSLWGATAPAKKIGRGVHNHGSFGRDKRPQLNHAQGSVFSVYLKSIWSSTKEISLRSLEVCLLNEYEEGEGGFVFSVPTSSDFPPRLWLLLFGLVTAYWVLAWILPKHIS